MGKHQYWWFDDEAIPNVASFNQPMRGQDCSGSTNQNSERWILRFSIKRQLGSKVGGRRWVKHIPGRFAPEGGDDAAAATDSPSWKLAVHHCKDSLPANQKPKLVQIKQSYTNIIFGGFIAIYTVYYPKHWPLLFFALFSRVFSRPGITIVMEFRL